MDIGPRATGIMNDVAQFLDRHTSGLFSMCLGVEMLDVSQFHGQVFESLPAFLPARPGHSSFPPAMLEGSGPPVASPSLVTVAL